MTNRRAAPFLAFLLAFLGSTADAGVVVTFAEPGRYSDVGRLGRDAADVKHEIERHLQDLGSKYLAADTEVRIEVLDVDLAGEERFRPRFGGDVRVLRGRADWPRMHLRYTVQAPGRTAETREETVSDPNYLMRSVPYSQERFGYEKRMLEEWFKARFAARS